MIYCIVCLLKQSSESTEQNVAFLLTACPQRRHGSTIFINVSFGDPNTVMHRSQLNGHSVIIIVSESHIKIANGLNLIPTELLWYKERCGQCLFFVCLLRILKYWKVYFFQSYTQKQKRRCKRNINTQLHIIYLK